MWQPWLVQRLQVQLCYKDMHLIADQTALQYLTDIMYRIMKLTLLVT